MLRLGEPLFRLRAWLAKPTGGALARATLLNWVVIGFALWTAASHACVLAHGNLFVLLGLFALALAGSILLILRNTKNESGPAFARCLRWLREQQHGTWTADETLDGGPVPRLPAWPLVATIMVLVASFWIDPSPLLLWIGGLLVLAIAALRLRFSELRFVACSNRRWHDGALLVLMAVCVFIVLIAHRQSSDDTFYVNIAVSVTDEPTRAILQYNTMVGVPGLELHLPIYKAHSYEVLAGFLAWITPLSALETSHFLLPVSAAVLMVLAIARFSVLLVGRHWIWCTIVVVLFLILEGSAYSGYSNHALVRFQHGKAVFVSVWLPLLFTYALEYSLRPSLRSWWMLLACQVGCVGLTGTATWMAPICVAFSLLCVWRPNWRSTRSMLLGGLSSVYLVGVGLWLRAEMMPVYDPAKAAPGSAPTQAGLSQPIDALLGEAMTWALGSFGVQATLMFCALVAWSACRPGSVGQRFCLLYPLVFLSFVFNPLLAEPIRVVSAFYWRVFWILPLPILFGVLSTGVFRILRGRARRLAPAVALMAATAVLVWVPDIHAVHADNAVRFRWLQPKVPGIYKLAQDVNRAAGPGNYALAPEDVSVWMTVMENHAYPLATKPKYLRTQRSMSRAEAAHRAALMRYVRGLDPHLEHQSLKAFERDFPQALIDYDLEVVCVYDAGPYIERLRNMLKDAGYERVKSRSRHTIWRRKTHDLGRDTSEPDTSGKR